MALAPRTIQPPPPPPPPTAFAVKEAVQERLDHALGQWAELYEMMRRKKKTPIEEQLKHRLSKCEGPEEIKLPGSCMYIASVDPNHCADNNTGCYLLSQDALLGARRSLDLLKLRPPPNFGGSSQLPPFTLWGFLSPDCWRYVRVRRRAGRRPILHAPDHGTDDERMKRLTLEAAQEWAHPGRPVRGSLRVVVSARCLPFLLDDVPGRLTKGKVRRDALATTVADGKMERRALVVQEVVVDRIVIPVVEEALKRYPGVLNTVVRISDEERSVADLRPSLVSELRAEAHGRRKLTAFRLIGLNLAVLFVNAFLAARGLLIWNLINKLQVVEWINQVRPHVGVTVRTMRLLDYATLPVRVPLRVFGVPADWFARWRGGVQ